MADQTIEQMVVDGSPARCFEVVADIEHYPDWVADLKEVHVQERDEEGRPSVVSFRAGAFGRSTSYTLVYDYSMAPTELRWVQREGDLTSRLDGIYRFMPAPEGGPRSPTSSQSSFACRCRASSSEGRRATSSTPRYGT